MWAGTVSGREVGLLEATAGGVKDAAEALLAPVGRSVLAGDLLPGLSGDTCLRVKVGQGRREEVDLPVEPALFDSDETGEPIVGDCCCLAGGGDVVAGVAAFPSAAGSGGVFELAEP